MSSLSPPWGPPFAYALLQIRHSLKVRLANDLCTFKSMR